MPPLSAQRQIKRNAHRANKEALSCPPAPLGSAMANALVSADRREIPKKKALLKLLPSESFNKDTRVQVKVCMLCRPRAYGWLQTHLL